MKKILILIPNLGRGGAQQVFRQQLKFLSTHFVTTGCVFNWNGAFPEDRSLNVKSLDVPAGNNFFTKAMFFWLRVWRLRKIKLENAVSLSISHLEGADYVNILSRGREKTICWIHGTKAHDQNIRGILGIIRSRLLIPITYRRVSTIITVSNGIAQEISQQFPLLSNKIETIHNGFDVNEIIALSKKPLASEFQSLFESNNTIITHCRLSRQKNLRALLAIFKKVPIDGKTKLILLGDGEDRSALLSDCDDLQLSYWTCWDDAPVNVEYQVYFLGHQPNPFNYLRSSSLYIMTSLWEGFPLALCEAMACGLPVIASDCFTGPREILFSELGEKQPIERVFQNELGFLMPLAINSNNESLQTWSIQLAKMLTNDYLSSFNKTLPVSRIKQFSIDSSLERTTKLLEKLST